MAQFLGADAAVGGASALHLYIGISACRSFCTSVVSVCCVSAYRAVCRVSGAFCTQLLGTQKIPGSEEPGIGGAPEGIRTPNLLIRSQMLYPLSYRRMSLPTGRTLLSVHPGDKSNPREDGHRAAVPADDGAAALSAVTAAHLRTTGRYPTLALWLIAKSE